MSYDIAVFLYNEDKAILYHVQCSVDVMTGEVRVHNPHSVLKFSELLYLDDGFNLLEHYYRCKN